MTNCPVTLPARYSVKEQNGGGQGVIFICNDSNLQRKVAVKWMKDTSQQHRLADEFRALQKIHSKHVVELYDLISEGENIAIILEFISGKELVDIDFTNLDPQAQIKILYQMACGIADIHKANHIHRDIKPHNMRMDDEGIVKILDFGLSREEDLNDNTVGFKGTMGFAAPELYSTGTVNFTTAIDVYAYAISVWFLYFKSLPNELSKRPPEPLQNALKNLTSIPPDVADLIDRGLAYNPADRPKIEEIRDLLKKNLLRNQHQGLVHLGNDAHRISSSNKGVALTSRTNKLTITYDGLDFSVKDFSGTVTINNHPVATGMQLPASCVITMGTYPEVSFIPFEISNPEVVL